MTDDRKRRLREAFVRRNRLAREQLLNRGPVDQPSSDDETRFGRDVNYFASYSKGLPHDDNGEVNPDAYETMRSALETPGGGDFDAIPEPGPRPLTNPEAATSFNPVGLDPNNVYAPPAPAFDSAETAAEMVELYWMALTRDVPFDDYGNHGLVADAANELFSLTGFTGPTNQQNLFRGTVDGTREGPHVSQFLLKNFERGVIERDQQFRPLEPTDYMIDFDDWLAVQKGGFRPAASTARRPTSPRCPTPGSGRATNAIRSPAGTWRRTSGRTSPSSRISTPR